MARRNAETLHRLSIPNGEVIPSSAESMGDIRDFLKSLVGSHIGEIAKLRPGTHNLTPPPLRDEEKLYTLDVASGALANFLVLPRDVRESIGVGVIAQGLEIGEELKRHTRINHGKKGGKQITRTVQAGMNSVLKHKLLTGLEDELPPSINLPRDSKLLVVTGPTLGEVTEEPLDSVYEIVLYKNHHTDEMPSLPEPEKIVLR